MKLNPNIRIISNDDRHILHDLCKNAYYEIDQHSYEYLSNYNELQGSGDAIEDFYFNKSVLINDNNTGQESVRKRKPFTITKIDLFHFDIDKIMNQNEKILNFLISEPVQKFGNVLYFLSIIIIFITIGGLIKNIPKIDLSVFREITIPQFIVFYFSIFFMTVFHELGHALQCKKHTGYVGSCGCMLFFLFPVLYTDVTVMRIASKNEKIKIILAGINNQIILGGVFGLISLLQILISGNFPHLFALLFIINLFMLFGNLNPLFKYDGYWLLSTIRGVDYLYSKAISSVFHLFSSDRTKDTDWKMVLYGFSLISFYVVAWSFTFYYLYVYISPVLGLPIVVALITLLTLLILLEINSRYKGIKCERR
ncbi:MAG: hypothetical protein PHX16_01430 [Syntrophaceticus sp.]|nr:hypothetical protein [Syntrophaceticus sp.]MDD3313994.1 hypothetical protein [Syntrophaceticus sp.]MDD4359303.1 hypothetical protein [Syntrophaceticus sp.]MDD4782294.1 hypothetical protein [Syntrophaceticus sp.]